MKMRLTPSILALFTALAICKIAQAAPTSFDTAGDSAYNSGWTAGSNGGYGWNGGWDFKNMGTATAATLGSDPSDGGIVNSPASPLGRAWEISGGTGGLAIRHTIGALQPGQVLSVDIDSPSGQMLFAFGDDHLDYTLIYTGQFQNSGPTQYVIESYQAWYTGIPWSYYYSQVPAFSGPIHMQLTALPIFNHFSNFTLQITSLTTGQSATIDNPNLDLNSGPYQPDVDTFYFGTGNSSPVYFNNVSITPEPGTLGMLGVYSLLLLRRRQNRCSSAGV